MNRAICCLWSSGDVPPWSKEAYSPVWVRALYQMLKRHAKPFELWVLHDGTWGSMVNGEMPDLVTAKMDRGLPSYARMAEAWDIPVEDGCRNVVFNLDLVIQGDVSWLWRWNEAPVGCHEDPNYKGRTACAVLTYDGEGQGLLQGELERAIARQWQGYKLFDKYPSEQCVVEKLQARYRWPWLCKEGEGLSSFKVSWERERGRDASIVYFHGSTKPSGLPKSHPLRKVWERA